MSLSFETLPPSERLSEVAERLAAGRPFWAAMEMEALTESVEEAFAGWSLSPASLAVIAQGCAVGELVPHLHLAAQIEAHWRNSGR